MPWPFDLAAKELAVNVVGIRRGLGLIFVKLQKAWTISFAYSCIVLSFLNLYTALMI